MKPSFVGDLGLTQFWLELSGTSFPADMRRVLLLGSVSVWAAGLGECGLVLPPRRMDTTVRAMSAIVER